MTKDVSTAIKSVTRGVPQDNGLSPLLFNICVPELPNMCAADTVLFADDITESDHHKNFEEVKKSLTSSFDEMKIFFKAKRLDINAEKTQFIVMKAPSKKIEGDLTITLDGRHYTYVQGYSSGIHNRQTSNFF